MQVCLNGEFVDASEAKISVFDHGLLYGDGVFDTIAAVDGRIFWLPEHIDRLIEGCQRLRITIPWVRESLLLWTDSLFRINSTPTSRLRITVTRGEGEIPLYSALQCKPNLIIFGTPLDLPNDSIYERGLRLKTASYSRIFPGTKNLSFLASVLAYLEAFAADVDDAIFVSQDGLVLEGATFNIFAVNGRTISTPKDNVLAGVTRAKVIELARSCGYTVNETSVPLAEIFSADEVFVTGTTKRIIPVVALNETPIGVGRRRIACQELLSKFRSLYF